MAYSRKYSSAILAVDGARSVLPLIVDPRELRACVPGTL